MSNDDRDFQGTVIGWRDISRYLGICMTTARNWERWHALPIARLPDGRAASTKRLLDQWFMSRLDAKGFMQDRMERNRKKQWVTDETSSDPIPDVTYPNKIKELHPS